MKRNNFGIGPIITAHKVSSKDSSEAPYSVEVDSETSLQDFYTARDHQTKNNSISASPRNIDEISARDLHENSFKQDEYED